MAASTIQLIGTGHTRLDEVELGNVASGMRGRRLVGLEGSPFKVFAYMTEIGSSRVGGGLLPIIFHVAEIRSMEYFSRKSATIVIIMMIAIAVVVIAIPVAVSVMVMIPMVIMFQSTAITLPIAYEILAALMAWPNPAGSRVWRPRPITFVPLVVPSDRIPVALDPHKLRPRSWREHANHPRGRRRPDADPNGNLSRRCDRAGQQEPGSQQDSVKRKRCKI